MRKRFEIVFNKLPKVRGQIRREVRSVVDRTTKSIAGTAVAKIMDPPKTGRIYRRETAVSFTGKGGPVAFTAYRGSTTEHQASAPGEAPATDTGGLAGSIDAKMIGPLTGAVDVHAEYGPVLEHGGENVEARPYLGPSVEEHRTDFRRDMAEAVRRGSAV